MRCRDAMGRPGTVSFLVRDDQAILTVPPGEAAVMTVQQLTQLIDAARATRDELFRRET